MSARQNIFLYGIFAHAAYVYLCTKQRIAQKNTSPIVVTPFRSRVCNALQKMIPRDVLNSCLLLLIIIHDGINEITVTQKIGFTVSKN